MNGKLRQSNTLWRVRLFEGPTLTDTAGNEVHRFRSRRVGALLAYLALNLGRLCSREELYEALWPEEDIVVVSNRLRVALASLRRQLEPPGISFGAVIDVGVPGQIRLRAETVWCDVAAFEAAIKAGRRTDAARLAPGRLLPGYYDEWVIVARDRLETLQEALAAEELQLPEEEAEPLPAEIPPMLSIERAAAHRLPLYLTRFFGREAERQHLLDLLSANRLVTVTGPGGIGKTRLVVETARQVRWQTVFVPLADLPAANHIPDAIMRALLITPYADTDPEDQLIESLLASPPALLILDNTDTWIATVAPLALRLLEALPDLRLLAIGRQRLDVHGEALLPLKSLEAPPHAGTPERLAEFPAVALFLDRARAVLPDFAFSPRHTDAVVEICRCLGGMPLALELAAARLTAQTPAQIAHSLLVDSTGLKSRQRGLPERHRSLREVIASSLALLPEEVRAFCHAFAQFRGAWTADMTRTMTGCERCEEYLELLVVSSLLERTEDERLGAMRFSFTETVRQFVLQHDSNPDSAAEWDSEDNLIVNGSFEQDRPTEAWLNVGGAMFPYPLIVPAGWQGIGSVNVNVPGQTAFPHGIPHGSNTAAVGDHNFGPGRLFQDVSTTLTAGTTYLLSARVGNRSDYSGSGKVRLETTEGRLLADSGTVMPAAGTFQQVVLTVTAHNDTAGLGERLRVALERVDGFQANFDCIHLTVEP